MIEALRNFHLASYKSIRQIEEIIERKNNLHMTCYG